MQHRKREDSLKSYKGKSTARNQRLECTNTILSFVISPHAYDFFKKLLLLFCSFGFRCFCIVLFCFGLSDHQVTSSDLFLQGHKEWKAEEMLESAGKESLVIGRG